MNPQEYSLNIRPGAGYAQTVKVSQGDVGRPLRFNLLDGAEALGIQAGTSITIHGTKPSGLGFTETCTWSGSVASVATTLEMTQENGTFPAELVLTLGNDVIGTANFMMNVERSPHDESVIDGTYDVADSIFARMDTLEEGLDTTNEEVARVAATVPAVDDTLTISGAAADAKKTGDEITQLKSNLIDSRLKSYTFVDGRYIDTNTYQEGTNAAYSYATINVAPYKNLHIRTHAYKSAGICFYDSNGNGIGYIYPTGTTDTYLFDELVTLPEGTAVAKITCMKAQKSDFSVWTTPLELYSGLLKVVDDTNDNLEGKVDKNGEKQVTSKNAEFMFYSPNLFDVSARTDGYIVNQVTGELGESSTNAVSDWIPVKALTNYIFSYDGVKTLRYCFYNANKEFISGVLTSSVPYVAITTPANAAYLRFSATQITQVHMQFEKGDVATDYCAYGTTYLYPQYAPQEKPIFNLPAKIYATVGYELNIYFENLVEDWTKYDWDISCVRGQQLERGFRVTPTSSDVGTFDLLIIATDGYMTISKKASLIITDSTAGSGNTASLIVLGDSTTANGIAVSKLNENFSDDVMSVETLGTRGTAPNKHEGRAGWTFNSYFTTASQAGTDVINPFFNPTTGTFDASYYFANSGVSVPDWFFINLGINDTFGYRSDSALEEAIITIKGLCDDMIESVKDAAPDIKIGLCLTIPPNHSQDAFGKAYNNGQNRNRYKRNNVLWVHSLIETYDGRESEGIYLIPIYTNLDTIYNMGMETLPVNARNTAITYESPIGNGGVHPVESGYWQIADIYTAFLKAYA